MAPAESRHSITAIIKHNLSVKKNAFKILLIIQLIHP